MFFVLRKTSWLALHPHMSGSCCSPEYEMESISGKFFIAKISPPRGGIFFAMILPIGWEPQSVSLVSGSSGFADGAKRVRIASRLSGMHKCAKSETLWAWSKSKRARGGSIVGRHYYADNILIASTLTREGNLSPAYFLLQNLKHRVENYFNIVYNVLR